MLHVDIRFSRRAERQVIGAGRSWHKTCFTCTACKRSLDSSTLQVRSKEQSNKILLAHKQDKDGQLFCNACYKKNFGPKGFRGGTSGAMEHTS